MTRKVTEADHIEKDRCTHSVHINAALIDGDECRILQVFKETENPLKFIENLVEEHTKAEQVGNEADKNVCKAVLVYLRHYGLDDSVVLKLVSFVTSRFADSRPEFRDRASFIATALFGKDEFNASARATFGEFKRYIKPNIVKEAPKRHSKYCGYYEATNKNVALSQNDYAHVNKNIFDSRFNPMHLQKALKVLQESSDFEALMSAHSSFGVVLKRASQRTLQIHAQAAFNQMMDLSHKEFYDLQFKNLAVLLSRDAKLVDNAIERLKSTSSDVLRAYILYSLDHLHEIADFDVKISLHLKISEAILNSDLKLDQVSQSAMAAFVEKGMKLLDGAMPDEGSSHS